MLFDKKDGWDEDEYKKRERTVQLKRNYLQKVHNKKNLPRRIRKQVQPVQLKHVSSREQIRTYAKRKGEIMDFEINVRAMMAAYYTGSGGEDIANCVPFLGIPGGKYWECVFTHHSPKMCKLIL